MGKDRRECRKGRRHVFGLVDGHDDVLEKRKALIDDGTLWIAFRCELGQVFEQKGIFAKWRR